MNIKNFFKKKLWKVFLLDLAFFISTILFIFYTRARLKQYLVSLQGYIPSLLNQDQNILEAQQLLQGVNELATNTYVFIFFLVPLIIFLLYVLLQGLSFNIIKKHKNYLLKFSLFTLLPYLILILFLFKNFNTAILILFFIFGYFSFTLYLKPNEKGLILAVKRFYKLIPAYILCWALFIASLSLFFLTYISIIAKVNFFNFLIPAIILTLLYSYYKFFLVKKLV